MSVEALESPESPEHLEAFKQAKERALSLLNEEVEGWHKLANRLIAMFRALISKQN